MGKAKRWLKGLFGLRKKWSFFSERGKNVIPPPVIRESDEQSKHAMAITAAAADAAVAVAQAAVALVKLTSHSNGAVLSCARERCAASLIQNSFRGYLARKALRALKGLVKLQALVRGHLVRKRTAESFRRIEALVRAQAVFRGQSMNHHHLRRHNPRALRSMDKYDEFHCQLFGCGSPKVVEVDTESRRHRIVTGNYGDDYYWNQKLPSFSCRIPTNSDSRHFRNMNWDFMEDTDYKFPTAHTTPRLSGWINSPATPSKTVYAEGFYGAASPNYMVDTQSFRAKLRSKSTPKQRPESEPKKKISFMASRMIFNGARFHRSKFPKDHRDINVL